MKKLIYILMFIPFLAHAAPGDRLFVAAERGFILAGPGEEHVLVMELQKNQELTELDIQGEWISVAVPNCEGTQGWIRLSQVSTTRIMEIPLGADDPIFEQFKLDVLALDDLVKASVVKGLYGKIQNKGDGLVFVGVSNTWLKFNRDERSANLKYLMYLWERLHKPGTPLTIQLVDARGQKLMRARLNRK